MAEKYGVRSIAFPAISCGAYGYPLDDAAEIAVRTVRNEIGRREMAIEATFVLFSDEIHEVFSRALVALD